MRAVRAIAALVFISLLGSGCSTMYRAGISVQPTEAAPHFTQREQDVAKKIVVDICRAERFVQKEVKPTVSGSPGPYLEFVSLDGKGSEQDTVAVSGATRTDQREILISVGDWNNSEPLPATEKLIEELRAALERAFPDARVEVTTHHTPRIFGP